MNAVLTAPAEQDWFWETAAQTTPRHDALAAFIRESYRSHFGANLASLMPEICALLDPDGLPRAVAGFRHAGSEPLFLEHYLDMPVEAAISAASGQPVDRNSVWEIGNLATRCPGAARFFVRRAALDLAQRGATWAVFTGTRRVVAVFRRLRVPLITLGCADPERLGEAAAGWGSYYEHAPRVVAGRVALGLAATCEGRA